MVERVSEQKSEKGPGAEYRVSWIFRVYRERGRLKADACYIGGGTGEARERSVRLEVAEEGAEVQDVQGETGKQLGLQFVGNEWRVQWQDRKFTARELDLMWKEFASYKAVFIKYKKK